MNRLATFFLTVIAACAHGANPGDEVVVVYNSRMPESKSVADHYAQMRRVPTNQVFGLTLSTNIEMTRQDFADHLQRPLANVFERERFWHIGSELVASTNDLPGRAAWRVQNSRIRYLVLCYGVPVRIAEDPGHHESADENLRPEFRRNGAAVDNELAVLPEIEQRPPLDGPLPNRLYGATNAAFLHPTNGLLIVTRLDGPSAEVARRLVDKALEAETNGLWGRAYFDLRGISDVNYKPGDDMLRAAAEIARRWGFETVVDTNAATFPPEFPMSHIAFYGGWYADKADGPFARPQVEFMPGAFAYHLHSYSAANLRSATANWVGPLLAKGATITLGSVDEPYLGGTPDVAVFLSRFTFNGFDFGEAAYAALSSLSWQTTVVGDPLYRPFAIPPQLRHAKLEKKHSPLIEWSLLNLANVNLAKGTPPSVIADFIGELPETRHSAVLTEKLADLYSFLGKPSSSAEMYATALALNPSPQQKTRLRLALAGKLAALDREADASADLLKLLEENPDYPGKLDIYRKLLAYSQKLQQTDDIARYEEIISRLASPPASAQK